MWNYEEVFHDVEQPTFFHEASRCIDFTPSINSLVPVRLHYLLVLRLDPSALIQNALICAPAPWPVHFPKTSAAVWSPGTQRLPIASYTSVLRSWSHSFAVTWIRKPSTVNNCSNKWIGHLPVDHGDLQCPSAFVWWVIFTKIVHYRTINIYTGIVVDKCHQSF